MTEVITPAPTGGTPAAHAASHQNGGSDEIDATGLTGAGGGGSAPASAQYLRTAGNYTTTSTTFVDVDGTASTFTQTITTGANRVKIGFVGTVRNSGANAVVLDVMVDGTSETGGVGLIGLRLANGSDLVDGSFVYETAPLAAGSHTFKLRWLATAGTATIDGGTGGYLQSEFWVEELA